ncbi:MAG: hypothetical protein ABIQ16_19430 [Polyangiaceae bacterium]
MIRSKSITALFAFGVLSCAAFTGGCSSSDSHAEESSATGTVSMPLVTTAGAHTYRLQGGMYFNGPTFTSLDISSDATVITTTLPTGNYSAYLYYWTLTRDDGTGTFMPVSATLVSDSQPAFTIFNHTATTLSFQFETDGQIVTVGAGQLNVAIGVHEGVPTCTVLGDDCPAESWCAPTELTGAALRCVASGTVAVGESCSAPTDCTANSSCFDFGAGALCQKLCTSAEFNQPCSVNEVCTPSGTEYGVCVPSPANNGAAGDAAD